MKKMTIITGLLFLAAGLVDGAAALKVVAPNGGENWQLRSRQFIAWTAPGITKKLKIVLFKNGHNAGLIATNIDPGGSPYDWTCGQYQGGTAAADGGYKIYVGTTDNTVEDFSDNTFVIGGQAAVPELKVTFPVGGETFKWGTLQPFQWSASGIGGNVKATLLRNGSPAYVLSPSIAATAGAVGWTIGDAPGWSCGSHCGGGYKLRVEALDGSASAESPGTFTIAEASPAGGGEPDFEPNSLDVYFQWKPDINLFNVLTLVLRISWQNKGADYTGPLKIRYMYLDALQGSKISKDAVLEIPAVSIGHNKGRADYLCTVEKIPDGVASITFAAMIDPDNQVKETNEKNNFKDYTVELDRSPDLAIEDARFSTYDFHNDDLVDAYFTVRNKGIEPANQFSVRITREDEKGKLLDIMNSMTIPVLGGCNSKSGPPASLPVHFQLQFTEERSHKGLFVIEVDYDKRVGESNEKNNKKWLSYWLMPTPDLAISSVKAKQDNMKLNCEFVVTNKGYAASERAYGWIHISAPGYDGYRKKIELGPIPIGSTRIYNAVIDVIWLKGDYLVLFIVDDCCRLEGGSRDLRYHDMDPRNNKVEIKCKGE